MKVGFIGLGNMGIGMATNLVKAGHEVTVYNRSAEKAQPLVALGAKRATDVAHACEGAAVVFTMLSDDAAVESVALGERGIVASLPKRAIHVSSSTISVALSKRLAQEHAAAGQRYVAAPVFGRPDAAAAGKLFIVAAGPADAVREVEPLLQTLGQRTFPLERPADAANLVKLSGNFLIASVIETLGEALALIDKAGIDRHAYLDILTSTLFAAPIYKTYGALIADRKFEPAGFAAPLGAKDVRLALAAAESLAVPLPVAGLLRDRFLRLIANGGEHLDWSALGLLAAQDAGLAK
ncbi:MAG TPA: NAD(P)-dependent oxidoreductase [Steroidobacteraceae bacterium]|nr:NAD(P)-dependent oxidoreductase [Steroidobacteraceae bacterium]